MAEFLATFQFAHAALSVVTGLKPCALFLRAFSPGLAQLEKLLHPPLRRLLETMDNMDSYSEKADCLGDQVVIGRNWMSKLSQ